jgi:hypothetical protein
MLEVFGPNVTLAAELRVAAASARSSRVHRPFTEPIPRRYLGYRAQPSRGSHAAI